MRFEVVLSAELSAETEKEATDRVYDWASSLGTASPNAVICINPLDEGGLTWTELDDYQARRQG